MLISHDVQVPKSDDQNNRNNHNHDIVQVPKSMTKQNIHTIKIVIIPGVVMVNHNSNKPTIKIK